MLRCFSVVAQAGNLAEAANQLSRTQSALSMTLKQFESELGQRLFETDRKSQLTPLGKQVFELAQDQLRAFDNSVNAIQCAANFPSGLIRIASVPSISTLVFPSAIRTLSTQYPGLKIELQDTDTQSVINALIQGHADLGIVSGHHVLNGIRTRLLFEDQFGLICSPLHPLATQTKSPTIKDIVSAGFVANNLCKTIESAEFQQALSQAKISVPNTLSLIGMVRDQHWVTVLPQQVAQVLPNDLRFRKIEGLDDKRPVHILIKEHSPNLRYAQELGEIICTQVSAPQLDLEG